MLCAHKTTNSQNHIAGEKKAKLIRICVRRGKKTATWQVIIKLPMEKRGNEDKARKRTNNLKAKERYRYQINM